MDGSLPRNREPPLKQLEPEEVAGWYNAGQRPGIDFIVIDVRRPDCESIIPGAINLPAHALPATLPSLFPMLSKIPKLVFHCNSSKGRATRAAGWVADALEESGSENVLEQVIILKGGINAWQEKYGKGKVEERGQKWDGKSLSTIQL